MGAEPYSYIVAYEPNIENALKKLRQQVFERGEFNGADQNPSSPDEALMLAGEDGTRSILDIHSISEEPEFCTASPFPDEELVEMFGTKKPKLEDVQDNDMLWEALDRGIARYIVLYEKNKPTQIYFAGYSFD